MFNRSDGKGLCNLGFATTFLFHVEVFLLEDNLNTL